MISVKVTFKFAHSKMVRFREIDCVLVSYWRNNVVTSCFKNLIGGTRSYAFGCNVWRRPTIVFFVYLYTSKVLYLLYQKLCITELVAIQLKRYDSVQIKLTIIFYYFTKNESTIYYESYFSMKDTILLFCLLEYGIKIMFSFKTCLYLFVHKNLWKIELVFGWGLVMSFFLAWMREFFSLTSYSRRKATSFVSLQLYWIAIHFTPHRPNHSLTSHEHLITFIRFPKPRYYIQALIIVNSIF